MRIQQSGGFVATMIVVVGVIPTTYAATALTAITVEAVTGNLGLAVLAGSGALLLAARWWARVFNRLDGTN